MNHARRRSWAMVVQLGAERGGMWEGGWGWGGEGVFDCGWGAGWGRGWGFGGEGTGGGGGGFGRFLKARAMCAARAG
ncbi:hypothetical protein FGB62_157g030 [Gracilaria domingensis]|nr:hypothetical protein FGB62_157g030 [Gracilaria domingensis]